MPKNVRCWKGEAGQLFWRAFVPLGDDGSLLCWDSHDRGWRFESVKAENDQVQARLRIVAWCFTAQRKANLRKCRKKRGWGIIAASRTYTPVC